MILFGFFCLLVLSNHLFAYLGHYGYDDMEYARIAAKWLEGTNEPENHFSFRWTTVGLTAISYAIFGINDWGSAFPGILITCLTLYFTQRMVSNKSLTTQFITLTFATLCYWYLFYADKLMSDNYVAFGITLALFGYVRHRHLRPDSALWKNALILAGGLIFAFLSKGSMILALPLFLVIFVIDLITNNALKFWLFAIGMSLALVGTYFLMLQLIYDDAGIRFKAINDNGYLNNCSYSEQPFSILRERLQYGLVLYLIDYRMLLAAALGVIAMKASGFKLWSSKFDVGTFAGLGALCFFLSSNFMTISFSTYNPMCLDSRHYFFMIPLASVGAGIALSNLLEHGKRWAALLGISAAFVVVGYIFDFRAIENLYFPLLCWVALVIALRNHAKKAAPYLLLGLLGIFIGEPIKGISDSNNIRYREQKALLQDFIAKQEDPTVIVTDPVQQRLGTYYNQFNPDHKVKFVDFEAMDTLSSLKNTKFLGAVNTYTMAMSNIASGRELPALFQSARDSTKALYYEKDFVEFYDLDNYINLDSLVSTKASFEEDAPFWENTAINLRDDGADESEHCQQPGEYSATFRYSLDSSNTAPYSQLFVEFRGQMKIQPKNEAHLVLSATSPGQEAIWHSWPLSNYNKAYGHWWSFHNEIHVPQEYFGPEGQVTIYVWNPELYGSVWLDNLEVTIKGLKKN